MVNKRYKNKRRSLSKTRILVSFFVLVIIAAGVILGLQLTHKINLLGTSKPTSQVITTAGTPTPAPKDNSSAGTSPSKSSGNTSATNRTIGGVSDTNGQATSTTNQSQWVTAASGAITVKQPTANSTIQNGSVLSGAATVNQVQYTLTDNSVGVISEGTLNVVNGSFSGTLEFTPHSSTGRLAVYSTTSVGGPEENLIDITVNF